MKTNLFLVTLGLILVCVGLYRISPVKIDSRFLWANGPLAVALAIILIVAYKLGGMNVVSAGVKVTLATTANFLPLLVLLMPVIGFSTPIAKFFEAELSNLLSSHFGYPAAFISSIISPSSSAFMGVVNKLWETPNLRGVLLYFTTISPLLSLNIFMMRRIGITNDNLLYSLYASSLGVAVWIIPFFWMWNRFMVK